MSLVNLRHLFRAGLYSLDGLKRAWSGEQAFRHEVLVLCCIPALLLWLRPGAGWCAAALGGWLLVMALELLNSAIEEAFDLVTQEQNIHVKYGKDMASAAILLGLAANGILWVCLVVSVL
jgi:Diacylglycerol kinase